ncbi:MAG: Flp pilus assembly protein CpaB [Phenylobacterium sp.]|nr:Flp pilus assembly protein CpaB [Phenylobacterium sp.]
MRVVTIVSLGVSAVLGLAALVVAKTVLPNQAIAKVPGVAGEASAGVPVVIASRPMKFGDKVDADHLRLIRVPAEAAPEGAFTTVAAVLSADHGGAPVVLTPIAAREPVLPAKLSGPGARASVAAEIGEGLRAYTIRVSDVSGVGGHALPGDRVDVVMLRDMNPMGPAHNFVSQVVLQDVRVLAIDLNADLASNKPATPSTATLEVSVEDSQKLAVAADLGKLSLALRRTGSAEAASTAPVRTSQFAGGGPAAAPVRAAGRTLSIRYSGPILIIQGERRGNGGGHAAPPPPPAAKPAASADSGSPASNG